MSKWVLIYLAVGIISRAVFFIYDGIVTKKYDLEVYKPLSIPVELIAHALDVIGWPYATFVSFYLIHKRIEEKRAE